MCGGADPPTRAVVCGGEHAQWCVWGGSIPTYTRSGVCGGGSTRSGVCVGGRKRSGVCVGEQTHLHAQWCVWGRKRSGVCVGEQTHLHAQWCVWGRKRSGACGGEQTHLYCTCTVEACLVSSHCLFQSPPSCVMIAHQLVSIGMPTYTYDMQHHLGN